jgi:hypothetical protein
MTGAKLGRLAELVGVSAGELLDTILKLRKNPKHDVYFTALPKALHIELIEDSTRKR